MAAVPEPRRHVLPRRAAKAVARSQGAVHARGAADPLARHLRRDVQSAARDPDRQPAVPRLPGARDHRPVRVVRRDLLRHPDHLGARRRRTDEAPCHADAALGVRARQGVRRRHPRRRAGRLRADRLGAARRRSDVQPAAHPRCVRRRHPRRGVLRMPVGDDRRHRAQARAADGHRPDDHDAAVLRVERPLPGADHAHLGARPQQDQPALVRGGRAARAPDRDACEPLDRLRCPAGRRGPGRRRGVLADRQARALGAATLSTARRRSSAGRALHS